MEDQIDFLSSSDIDNLVMSSNNPFNSLSIVLPYDYAKNKLCLNWKIISLGVEMKYFDKKVVIDFASEQLLYESNQSLILATLSNKEGRYLGKTDEALSPDGIRTLEKSVTDRIYPIADVLFSGPMKRCLETAQILYPGQTPICIPEWTEMDFGAFEGHNYQELSGDPNYQRWIDSGGTLPFPEGESREEFIRRSVAGYEKMVYHMKRIWERSAASGQRDRKIQNASAVVHGGTIMALLGHFLGGEYFDYQVKCGQGYSGRLAFKAGGGAPQWKEFRPLSEAAVSELTKGETNG